MIHVLQYMHCPEIPGFWFDLTWLDLTCKGYYKVKARASSREVARYQRVAGNTVCEKRRWCGEVNRDLKSERRERLSASKAFPTIPIALPLPYLTPPPSPTSLSLSLSPHALTTESRTHCRVVVPIPLLHRTLLVGSISCSAWLPSPSCESVSEWVWERDTQHSSQ